MAKKSGRVKRPYVASPDQVRILRQGGTAVIEYAEDGVMTTRIAFGPELERLTDAEVLEWHNEQLRAEAEVRRQHEYVAIEVPFGSPQIEFHPRADQHVPRGDVLRVVVTADLDSADRGAPAFIVDDQQLTLQEFGRLLLTWEGWGLRITAVPEDELTESPTVQVRDPD